jgi:hypothetical protein
MYMNWPAILLLLPLGGVAWWVLTRPPGLVLQDSPEFVAAIDVWQAMIVSRHRTPRALKRFMNRVRFLAMRGRPEDPNDTLLSALGEGLGEPKPDPEPATTASIPEPALVALAAIHAFNPSWLRRADILDGDDYPADLSNQIQKNDWESFVSMRAKHSENWGWDLANWRGTFLRMCADVSVR